MSLLTWLQCFQQHYANEDNALTRSPCHKNPIFVTFGFDLDTASLALWAQSSVAEISLQRGVQIDVNTLITHISHVKAGIILNIDLLTVQLSDFHK